MRDWTELFVAGKPVYEALPDPCETELRIDEGLVTMDSQGVLNEADFKEYQAWHLFCAHDVL